MRTYVYQGLVAALICVCLILSLYEGWGWLICAGIWTISLCQSCTIKPGWFQYALVIPTLAMGLALLFGGYGYLL
jgi:hypothetical protein